MNDTLLLSLIAFLPVGVAVLLSVVPGSKRELIKTISFAATVVVFVLTLFLVKMYFDLRNPDGSWPTLAERAAAAKQALRSGRPADPKDLVVRYPWIRPFEVEYYLGVDGISLPLIVLTSFISMLAMLASWNIDKYVRGYCMLFLLLETGMLGTFLALDFFLFYVFWELMLLPMYFLIGVWGAPSRVEVDGRVRGGPYAAIKFFIYTLVGSVLILIALLAFYFHPAEPGGNPAYTFDLMRLHEIGQSGTAYSLTFQIVMFLLLYVGFAIKVPLFPFHTWLPDAHVEAPTPISMILAGILLKMGGYGFARIAYPICPEAAQYLAWFLVAIGVINILYGALAAMAQTDFKKLVAYSSISHMGYVMLGFAVWSLAGDPNKWSMAFNGAMFQMIAHGISSPAMFFAVGVIYDRVHHRDLNRMGGLANIMPFYAGLSTIIFFAGMGLPGLCGFIGEVFTVLGSWQFSRTVAVLAASGVILTAGYILWTLQRVFLGTPSPNILGEGHGEGHDLKRFLPDLSIREWVIAVPMVVMAVVLGVYPDLVFRFMEPSVTDLILDLTKAVAGVR